MPKAKGMMVKAPAIKPAKVAEDVFTTQDWTVVRVLRKAGHQPSTVVGVNEAKVFVYGQLTSQAAKALLS